MTSMSYYGGEDEKWTCIFPGKMGISWKRAWEGEGTRAEAEAQAAKNRNVIAVPVALWLRYKEYEHRCVAAERKLMEVASIRLDYDKGEISFTDLSPKT
jgi:hypothetical protein